jgi:hypothetical protein
MSSESALDVAMYRFFVKPRVGYEELKLEKINKKLNFTLR